MTPEPSLASPRVDQIAVVRGKSLITSRQAAYTLRPLQPFRRVIRGERRKPSHPIDSVSFPRNDHVTGRLHHRHAPCHDAIGRQGDSYAAAA